MAKSRRTERGRVTPSKASMARRERAGSGPPPSARYTPPTPSFRVRPRWHRWAGWFGVAVGVVVAAMNDLMLMGEDLTLLPGGHSELYLLLGVAIAGSATWFLGLFDRGTTVFD